VARRGEGRDPPCSGGWQNRTLAAAVAGRPEFSLRQGKSVGALYLLHQLAGELNLPAALGDDREGRLALWQVLARAQDQGSRLSAVRLARNQTVSELIGLQKFTEEDLYTNLDWLAEQQTAIEDHLFRARYPNGKRPSLFLYDVTSTYLEGMLNELGAFGYNRDGKRGKKQLVVGLLTDQDGWPLAVEVFKGNTNDPATVSSQIQKLAERFGGSEVTLVGDRGMLKSRQIDELTTRKMHYITAITKPQIEALLKSGTLQMELFDADLAEVIAEDEGVRYVLRCNPAQAQRVAARRADQLATWQRQVEKSRQYLAEHPRARVATAVGNLTASAKRLKLHTWATVEARDGTVHVVLDEAARAAIAKLDGCYVLKTDLKREQAAARTVDARYRDLAQVEWGFRTCLGQTPG
jgi:transposase